MTRPARAKTQRSALAYATSPTPTAQQDSPILARCAGMLIALFLLAMFATVLFHTRATTVGGSEMNWDRAIFSAINAITLSGFRLPINVGDLKGFGQLITYLLVATSTISYLLIGGWSLKRVAGYDIRDLDLMRFTLVLFTIATLFGASLLLGSGIGLLQSVFDATAALGNCGLFLGRLPDLQSFKLHAVLLPLAIIGGLSMPVIYDLWHGITHSRRITPHTIGALFAAAVVYLIATPLLWLIEGFHTAMPASLLQASALAIDTRTLGQPLELSTLTAATPWLLIVLIGIGASTGGTGGGVKSNTLIVLIRDTWNVFFAKPVSRIFAIALLTVGGYIALVITTILALSLAEPTVGGEQIHFAAMSAVSNCGLSQQPINFGSAGLVIMSLAMIAGRLWSLAMLLLCVQQRITSNIAVG